MANHRARFKNQITVKGSRYACILISLFRDEGGQALTEYILIIAATVVGAGAISRKILETLDKGILKLGGQLEKDLKTGRADIGIWTN